MKQTVILGIGDLDATKKQDTILKTLALGSCVGVVLIHKNTGTIGMVHVALPDSKVNTDKAMKQPGYFANTGIPQLVSKMKFIANIYSSDGIVAKLAGGASVVFVTNDKFNIGARNIVAVVKILAAMNIPIMKKDIGGTIHRTISIEAQTNDLIIDSPGIGKWKI